LAAVFGEKADGAGYLFDYRDIRLADEVSG
jgi:hypothetical protein